MSELSAGVATRSKLDNLIRANYNLFKPSNFAMTENRAEFSKLCLKCYQATSILNLHDVEKKKGWDCL